MRPRLHPFIKPCAVAVLWILGSASAPHADAQQARWYLVNEKLNRQQTSLPLGPFAQAVNLESGWACTIGPVSVSGARQTTCTKGLESFEFTVQCDENRPRDHTQIRFSTPTVKFADFIEVGCELGVRVRSEEEPKHEPRNSPPEEQYQEVEGAPVTVHRGSSGRLVVRSDYKNVTGDSRFVQAEGRWRIASDPKHDILTQINSVQIVCEKAKGTCTEIVALLYTARDEFFKSIFSGNFLTLLTQEYQVLDWSESAIVAIASPPPRAADIELRISIEHKTAERILQETEARGAQGALAQPKRWVLE